MLNLLVSVALDAEVPPQLRRHMTPVSLALLVLFNAYVLAFVLYPFYWL